MLLDAEQNANDLFGKVGYAVARFQAAVFGCPELASCQVALPDALGMLHKDGPTMDWLRAFNAPRWVPLNTQGTGWNIASRPCDFYGWGTHWLLDVVADAGNRYEASYRKGDGHTAPMSGAHSAQAFGGGGHEATEINRFLYGHQAGIDIALRLPTTAGVSDEIMASSALYDRTAARAMLTALRASGRVTAIHLNDEVLIGEGLCTSRTGAENRIHVIIRAPVRCGAGAQTLPAINRGGVKEASFATVPDVRDRIWCFAQCRSKYSGANGCKGSRACLQACSAFDPVLGVEQCKAVRCRCQGEPANCNCEATRDGCHWARETFNRACKARVALSPEAADECFTRPEGGDYLGLNTTTHGGFCCLPWNAAEASTHWVGAHNFCRNPNGQRSAPWCYTHFDTLQNKWAWDYCNVGQPKYECPAMPIADICWGRNGNAFNKGDCDSLQGCLWNDQRRLCESAFIRPFYTTRITCRPGRSK